MEISELKNIDEWQYRSSMDCHCCGDWVNSDNLVAFVANADSPITFSLHNFWHQRLLFLFNINRLVSKRIYNILLILCHLPAVINTKIIHPFFFVAQKIRVKVKWSEIITLYSIFCCYRYCRVTCMHIFLFFTHACNFWNRSNGYIMHNNAGCGLGFHHITPFTPCTRLMHIFGWCISQWMTANNIVRMSRRFKHMSEKSRAPLCAHKLWINRKKVPRTIVNNGNSSPSLGLLWQTRSYEAYCGWRWQSNTDGTATEPAQAINMNNDENVLYWIFLLLRHSENENCMNLMHCRISVIQNEG